ncbi:MAG: hypothetical protein ABII79_02625 [bacterium]
MDIITGINRFIGLLVETARQFRQGRIWLLLLGYLAVNWLILQGFHQSSWSVTGTLVTFWTALVDSEQAIRFTHYPDHLVLLPAYFGWAKLLLAFFVEGPLLGALAIMFHGSFMHIPSGQQHPIRSALSAWFHLVAAWVIIYGLVLLLYLPLPQLLAPLLAGSGKRMLAFEFVLQPAAFATILALFFFVIPRIAVYRESLPRALARSVPVVVENPITCLTLAAFILAIPILLMNILNRAPQIADRFTPETVYWLLAISLPVDTLFYFFWMGTAVRFLIDEER